MSEILRGRPKANIDWEKVKKLLIAGCSGAEIAANFGLNQHTIYERCVTDNGMTFSDYSNQYYKKGESLLREVQFDKALSGDNTMLVWLGKNRLKQKEKEDDTLQTHAEALKKLDEFISKYGLAQNKPQTASIDASNIVNTNSKSE